MASEFAIGLVAFGDPAGLGAWEIGHYRQHLRYNAFLAAMTPPAVLTEFPILRLVGSVGAEIVFWLDAHEKWHELIRPFANVTGVNLSGFDIENREIFYQWLDLHNAEHQEIDQAFGLS